MSATTSNTLLDTLHRLTSQGRPALPVAPAFPAEQYPTKDGKPMFTGKNPSYLDQEGTPHLLKHSRYQEHLPSQQDNEKFFATYSGIGTMGGWANHYPIDIDAKCFDSLSSCEEAALELASKIEEVTGITPYMEKTPSGGYHIDVAFSRTAEFTNFALEPGGKHRGEILGKGRFCVLAPTPGYTEVFPYTQTPTVESPQAIGLYSTRKDKPPSSQLTPKPLPQTRAIPQGGVIALEALISEANQAIMSGYAKNEDRSADLATLAQDLFGWENWCRANGVTTSGDVLQLLEEAAAARDIDSDRLGRILLTVTRDVASPALFHIGGEEACWRKVCAIDPSYRRKKPNTFAPKGDTNSKWGDAPEITPKSHSIMAKYLQGSLSHKLRWHTKEKAWYLYEADAKGVWGIVDEEEVFDYLTEILDRIDEQQLFRGYTTNYATSILRHLKGKLNTKGFKPSPGLMAFHNGVVHLDTLSLVSFSPQHELTWGLPYPYEHQADCKPIKDWMFQVMDGDPQLVQVLRALLNCVLFGRYKYQRFLEAVGPGGSGKGTFFRLAAALVGEENTISTTLKQLEENKFETASLEGAKLIQITEAEKYGGDLNTLKALTGQDKIRYEAKNRQRRRKDDFTFQGMVFLSANEPIRSGDQTSGIGRRKLFLPFNFQPEQANINLQEELEAYLPGLFNWVVSMPESEVRALVLDTAKSVPQLALKQRIQLAESNSLAEWMDECLLYDPESVTNVGNRNFDRTGDWLYANYCEYAIGSGTNPISAYRFSRLLDDLCCNQLHLQVRKVRDEKGARFFGLQIRGERDTTSPRPITGTIFAHKGGRLAVSPETPSPDDFEPSLQKATQSQTPESPTTDEFDALLPTSDGLPDAETLATDETDGLYAFFNKENNGEPNSPSSVETTTQLSVNKKMQNPSETRQIHQHQGFQPPQTPSETRQNPSNSSAPRVSAISSEETEQNSLKPGVKVTSPKYPGEVGEVCRWHQEWSEWEVLWETAVDYHDGEELTAIRISARVLRL